MKSQMTIPDEAVQAAVVAQEHSFIDGYDADIQMKSALTAALPLLTGVKVKALEWDLASGDHYAEGLGTHYNIYETRPDFWNCVTVKPGNVRLATNVSLEAAKAAAQADYEDRILSAIEVAPSPRAQALEEAAKIAFDVSENGEYHGEASVDSTSSIYQQGAFEVYEAIRALSSQPVADGWLLIKTAPKDGTDILVWSTLYRGKPVIVRWEEDKYAKRPIPRWISSDSAYGARSFVDSPPTHWRPLPATPGASE